MRIKLLIFALPAMAAASLLTSCSSVNRAGTDGQGGGTGSSPAKTTPVIAWPQPAAIDTATPLSAKQLNATANVAGTFKYTPAAGSTLAAGTQALSVSFTPQDAVHYTSATASVSIVVSQPQTQSSGQAVTIQWTAPASIPYPTPLGEAQLDAVAAALGTQDYVPGKFKYTPGYGTVLSPGTHTLSATFTPNDTSTYSTTTATVQITVGTPTQCGSDANMGTRPFVYASSWPYHGDSRIIGYAGGPDGRLAPLPGSPIYTPGTAGGTGIGPLFFGTDGYSIYSYKVHSDGCLNFESALTAGQGDPENPQNYMIGPYQLFLDRSEANLYSWGFGTDNGTAYASYSFDPDTGRMSQTSLTNTDFLNIGGPLAFPSNSNWGITSDYTIRGGRGISAFNHYSDGSLSTSAVVSEPKPDIAAPYGAAADATNHLVIAQQHCTDWEYCDSTEPWRFAVYSIDDAGNISTTQTWDNMAVARSFDSANAWPSWYAFSPDNRYLAAVGFTGIELFAWDSQKAQLSHIATIKNDLGHCQDGPDWSGCKGIGFERGAWDSYDHLYTHRGNELYVYTVSAAGMTQAPGSPYEVKDLVDVTVVGAGTE